MNTLGLIFSYSEKENLRELTRNRTLAALTFGGKYRIIDFVLSNFVNSGINEVSILARSSYHSLINHLGSGAEWDMSRKRGGLRVLTPFASPQATESDSIYRGTLDALNNHLNSIQKSMAEYVILTGSRIVYSMDYQRMLADHLRTGADITVAYTNHLNGSNRIPQGAAMLQMDHLGRVRDVDIVEDEQENRKGSWCIDLCIMGKTLLESLVADAISHGRFDIQRDLLQRLAPSLKIYGYEHNDYLLEFSTIASYTESTQALLDRSCAEKIFANTVYTRVKDSVPAHYGPTSYVENSMISDGCRIFGAVINSVVSRGVHIGEGAVVKDSIVMQDADIMNNARVDMAILDKDVIVRTGREVIGHRSYPVVLSKMTIV